MTSGTNALPRGFHIGDLVNKPEINGPSSEPIINTSQATNPPFKKSKVDKQTTTFSSRLQDDYSKIWRIFLTQLTRVNPTTTHQRPERHKNVLLVARTLVLALEFFRWIPKLSPTKNAKLNELQQAQRIFISEGSLLGHPNEEDGIVSTFDHYLQESKGNPPIFIIHSLNHLFEKAQSLQRFQSYLENKPHLYVIGVIDTIAFYNQNKKALSSFELLDPTDVFEKNTWELIFAIYNNILQVNDEQWVDRLISLTETYLPSEPLPERVITLIEESIAHYRLMHGKEPKQLTEELLLSTLAKRAGVTTSAFNNPVTTNSIKHEIEKSILGQPHAILTVASAICSFLKGFSEKTKPPGIFLFAGPPHVGKERLAERIAQIISEYRGKCRFIKVTNNTLRDLDNFLKDNNGAFSVILYNEIKKASPEALSFFSNLFEEDQFQPRKNRTIRNAFFIFTTNLDQEEISQISKKEWATEDGLTAINMINKKIVKIGEWTERLEVIPFYPLTEPIYQEISINLLKKLGDDLKNNHNLTLEWTTGVCKWLSFNAKANPQGGIIYIQQILTQTARTIADMTFREKDTISISFYENQLAVQIKQPNN